MKLRTIAIDDEPIALEKLSKYIRKIPYLELVGTYNSAMQALPAIEAGEVDLMYTDIDMPDLNGMDFIKSLPEAPLVVFITAYSEYAVESYKVSALDYLLKPYGFSDFQQSAAKAIAAISVNNPPAESRMEQNKWIFVKVDHKYIRVNFDSISYIKGYGEYLQIFIDDKPNAILTLSSFGAIMQQLPSNFLQIHRSYIVNIDKIDRIERNRVIIDPDTYIPIGQTFREGFDSCLSQRSVGGK